MIKVPRFHFLFFKNIRPYILKKNEKKIYFSPIRIGVSVEKVEKVELVEQTSKQAALQTFKKWNLGGTRWNYWLCEGCK